MDNFLWFILGIGGNLIAAAIWDRWRRGPEVESAWQKRFQSLNQSVRTQAFREALVIAFRWYIIANILWVISGIAWSLDAVPVPGMDGAILGRVVMVVTAVLSLLFFGVALRWLNRFLKYAPAVE